MPALHEMHESIGLLLIEAAGDVDAGRELRACASAIEAELISRNQAVARLQF